MVAHEVQVNALFFHRLREEVDIITQIACLIRGKAFEVDMDFVD
jgi:hypothetical protein